MKSLQFVEIEVPSFANLYGNAAGFDGSTYLARGAGLTGAADSKQWTFSVWLRLSSSGSGLRWVTADGAGVANRLVVLSDNTFETTGVNSSGTQIWRSKTSALPSDEWVHVMGSVDLSNSNKHHLYVNDISDIASAGDFTDDTMDFTQSNWFIGTNSALNSLFDGDMAFFWCAPGVYIDLSQEENRRKFITEFKTPAYLGEDGSRPTGTAPLIYLAGPAPDWETNLGTGGDFTTTGSLSVVAEETETFRFAIPTDYLPRDIDCIPSISGISFKPATISLGKDLGERATLQLTFKDHRHILNGEDFDSGTFWGKWRARYGQKLRGRAVRWYNGVEGQTLDEMPTRHFFIDSTDGPTPDGVYTISAKDLLKFADDERAQAPTLSNGRLAGLINSSTTSATLTPTGIGDEEYPASGYLCLGGKEVVGFTRSGDTLTLTRGEFNTTAIQHEANERAQIVLYYDGDDVADIIQDLLVNYAGVDSTYIPITEWQTETADNLGVLYARAITEPTPVKKLVGELIEQAALALWWDELAQVVRLQVLKEIATDADTFDEGVILQNSLKVKDQPDKRISQIWTYYGQRNPADRGDNDDNYRNALAEVDLERETEYGSASIRKVIAPWIATLNAAERLNQVQISRFRDPPRRFNFDLFPGTSVIAGQGYRIKWRQYQDILGNLVDEGAPIQITRLAVEAGVIRVEAEEMLASGTVVLTNVIFLTETGSLLNWTVPDDWNSTDNLIHVIAGGGGGGSGTGNGGGGGGGGAAYSGITNLSLTPGASVQYQVGAGGVGASGTAGTVGGDTWFNGASLGASSVGAKGGQGGTTGNTRTSVSGGQASSGVGTTKTSGGQGGRGASKGETRAGGGGGGGAGGPNGDGGDGGEISSTASDSGAGGGGANGGADAADVQGSNGGNNRFNYGGGTSSQIHGIDGGGGKGGVSRESGTTGDGGDGEPLWTQTIAPIISAGPGGGGGGGGSHFDFGGAGGLYGGGGGGGGGDADRRGGHGGQGVIVIIYRGS